MHIMTLEEKDEFIHKVNVTCVKPCYGYSFSCPQCGGHVIGSKNTLGIIRIDCCNCKMSIKRKE